MNNGYPRVITKIEIPSCREPCCAPGIALMNEEDKITYDFCRPVGVCFFTGEDWINYIRKTLNKPSWWRRTWIKIKNSLISVKKKCVK